MHGFEVREKLTRRHRLALFRVLQSLPDALFRIGAGGYIEQTLVRRGVLHHGGGLPFHCQDHFTVNTAGRLVLFSCLMKSPDRLEPDPLKAPFKVPPE
jgi:hypothetical protein